MLGNLREIIWSCQDAEKMTGLPNNTVLLCPSFIIVAAFPATLTIFTILGNTFVLLAVCMNSKLRQKQTSILIANLAIADLLVSVFAEFMHQVECTFFDASDVLFLIRKRRIYILSYFPTMFSILCQNKMNAFSTKKFVSLEFLCRTFENARNSKMLFHKIFAKFFQNRKI